MTKKHARVRGASMAYAEAGEGRPIVFLHGNPTSSHLWRDVIPHVAGLGRAIAPDLIGMGDSDKLPGTGDERYRFAEHRAYLDALLEQLDVRQDVILVVHDWGSALGFDWARRHPDAVAGIAYMEAIVRPFRWDAFGEAEPFFRALRGPEGERLVLEENAFIEQMLPLEVLRDLTAEVRAEYLRPFAQSGEARRPMLTWAREVPIDGEPADVQAIVEAYSAFMAQTAIAKLFVNAEPGLALRGGEREYARTWPNQTEVTVAGLHLVQEDSADQLGTALATWLSDIAVTE